MRDYITLGSAPLEEDCICVDSRTNYLPAMKEECRRYKQYLEQLFPNKPEGCYFTIKSFEHDFGLYYEVCVIFDDEIEEQVDFAYHVEENLPLYWQ